MTMCRAHAAAVLAAAANAAAAYVTTTIAAIALAAAALAAAARAIAAAIATLTATNHPPPRRSSSSATTSASASPSSPSRRLAIAILAAPTNYPPSNPVPVGHHLDPLLAHGYHLIGCRVGPHRNRKHDMLNKLIAAVVQELLQVDASTAQRNLYASASSGKEVDVVITTYTV